MRKRYLYVLFLAVLFVQACDNAAKKELMKWRVTLEKDDKLPYNTYLAYHSLQYYFPHAAIEPLSNAFRYTSIDNEMKYGDGGHALLILHGLDFYLSLTEWNSLKEFVHNGNEVVIFCSALDEKIEQELNCRKEIRGEEDRPHYNTADQNSQEKSNEQILSVATDSATRYGYSGRSIRGYFSLVADSETIQTGIQEEVDAQTEPDTVSKAEVLGYANSKADFVRYAYGNGHITLHAAPLVLTNYFLLQPDNVQYLTAIWHTLPDHITKVYWNSYYKRNAEVSSLDILWRYPSTRLALLIAILAIVSYVAFEGKRRQRIIPVIAPLRNDSVSFAETVGRLYYNKGNHLNLAEKMVQQFLEWVRTHHYLNTSQLNDQFIQQLSARTGQSEGTVRQLMDMIHEIKLSSVKPDDAYLYQLYRIIQQFYKQQNN